MGGVREECPDTQKHVLEKFGNRPVWGHLGTFHVGEKKNFFSWCKKRVFRKMCVCRPKTNIFASGEKKVFFWRAKMFFLEMFVFGPESHILKTVHTTLKLCPHLAPSTETTPNPSETSLGKVSQLTFLESFRQILSKKCVFSPKSHILKNVRTTLKLGLHHPPSAGRVSGHSETCFEKDWKSAFTGSFGHILGKMCVYNSESHILKSVQIVPKLCLHLPPSGGGVPRHLETCLDKVGKSAFSGLFRQVFSGTWWKKNFFLKNFFLFQLPPPFF